jgi:hypothetical protein
MVAMKRLLGMTAVLAGALLTTSVTAYAGTLTATANEHPIGGSGVSGMINFVDNGSTLTVTGVAAGLTPGVPYFSLIYTDGTQPGGISEGKSMPPTSHATAACNDFNKAGNSAITSTQMVLGFWKNNGDGSGTLLAVKSSTSNSQDGFFKSLPAPPIPGLPSSVKTLYDFFQFAFGYETNGDFNSYAPIGNTWNTASLRNAANGFALVACGQVH